LGPASDGDIDVQVVRDGEDIGASVTSDATSDRAARTRRRERIDAGPAAHGTAHVAGVEEEGIEATLARDVGGRRPTSVEVEGVVVIAASDQADDGEGSGLVECEDVVVVIAIDAAGNAASCAGVRRDRVVARARIDAGINRTSAAEIDRI